jgi:hypothetical protein
VVQDVSTWQEIALVASPALAAIAAAASWASVLQARKLRKEQDAPWLQIQLTYSPEGRIGAVVTNAGAGVAGGVQIVLHHGNPFAAGPIGHGFMFPGDIRVIETEVLLEDPSVNTRAIVSCRDRASIPQAWTADERHQVSTTWRGKPVYRSIIGIFQTLYPDVDPMEGDQVGMKVSAEQG